MISQIILSVKTHSVRDPMDFKWEFRRILTAYSHILNKIRFKNTKNKRGLKFYRKSKVTITYQAFRIKFRNLPSYWKIMDDFHKSVFFFLRFGKTKVKAPF